MIISNQTFRILLLFFLFNFSLQHTIGIIRHQSSEKLGSQCTPTGNNNQTTIGYGNCQNNIYYINIQIGTPSQTMGVQFDTGSNTLWVPTQLVANVTPTFNTAASSTFTNTSNSGGVQYADGSGVSGTYGTDVFKIQNTNINIVTQYLWVYSQTSMSYPAQIQGLVGMGYTNSPNFLDVAFQNNQISSPIFALQILNNSQQSLLYYNQIPPNITNSTIFEPVIGNTYWQVQVTNVQVGGQDMTSVSSNAAVIDSGTSYFYVNPQLYSLILNTYFQNCQIIQSTPVCSCSTTSNWPSFTFTFTKVQVYIQPQQYIGNLGNNLCTPLFGSISGVSQLLLGDIFFRTYIITFDKVHSQIGFMGNLNQVDASASTNTTTILGWVLVGLISGVIVFGIIACCCIDSVRSKKSNTGNTGFGYNTNKTSVSANPNLTLNLKSLEIENASSVRTRLG